MHTLAAILKRRSRRELEAAARAHGLEFSHKPSRQQQMVRLHHDLTADGRLRQAFRALTDDERAALAALQAAGGEMPLPEFTAAFGRIRPYRPWQPDAPRHPWRHPASAAERLWFLAFVDVLPRENGSPARVCAPAEVLALLPPLPRPQKDEHPSPLVGEGSGMGGTLRRDVAALLGGLLYEDVRPLWGRWLPPRALKALNLRLAVRENLDSIRSELRAGRVRFLHYLVEAAGLVGMVAGLLKPTAAAWSWLDSSPGDQRAALWQAWEKDISQREPLWGTYRLPPLTPRLWSALAAELDRLPPGEAYTVPSLLDALRPFLPAEPSTLAAVPDLLRGPFAWFGRVRVEEDRFATLPPLLSWERGPGGEGQGGEVVLESDTLRVTLPPLPDLRPFVEALAWAEAEESGALRVDAAAVARAVGRGMAAPEIAGLLAALAGKALPAEIVERIESWARQAGRLSLRSMTVLTSPEPDLLARLRADRALRPLFAETLSPHHLAVQPHRAADLRRKLARRGQPVTDTNPAPPVHGPDADTPPGIEGETAAYLYLAARVYARLGAFISLPMRLPGAVSDTLAARLPASQVSALDQSANALIASLADAIEGRAFPPSPVAQDDPAGIRRAVEAAYEGRRPLTIDYLSPALGIPTRRTIEPILPPTGRGGAVYVEAWCRRDEAARTFRLDRILRVVE